MALVNTTEMFKKAYEGGYAIGAFNVNNMEIIQGITEAAMEQKAPLILQVSAGARKYAKHNYLVKNAEDAVGIMREAFYIAKTGRPGPVVIDIPLDIQKELIEFTPCEKPEIRGYNPEPELDVKQIKKLAKMLRSAKRPDGHRTGRRR